MSLLQEGFLWMLALSAILLIVYVYANFIIWLEEFDNAFANSIIMLVVLLPIYGFGILMAYVLRTKS